MADEKVTAEQLRETKRLLKAPCMFTGWSDRYHKEIEMYPAVNCTRGCDTCGWNPKVAEKRIEKMNAELEKEAKKWHK